MLRTIFIVLMIMLALVVAAVAILNNESVTVNYLFGQINLTLFSLILGSALAGVMVMFFYSIYRSIHNYIKAEGERGLKRELQRRVRFLEGEKKKLEDELGKFKKERDNAAAKAHAELEAEKRKLEDELNRQKRERDNATAKEQAQLETEKRKLEDELKKQQKESENLKAKNEDGSPKKKGILDFFKK